MNDPLKCFVSRDAWDPFQQIRVVIGGRTASGKIVRMETPKFITYTEDDTTYFEEGGDKQALTIHSETAQSLMDELWNIGIRPTAGHGSTGQLAATERHLEDLRALVFKDKVPPRGGKS